MGEGKSDGEGWKKGKVMGKDGRREGEENNICAPKNVTPIAN